MVPVAATDTSPVPTVDEWYWHPIELRFSAASTAIDTEGQGLLRELTDRLRSRSDVIRVRVEGHNDTEGVGETDPDMSMRRAEAVRTQLVRLGWNPELLESVALGASQPVSHPGPDRRPNRRVGFNILMRRQVGAPRPLF